MVRTSGAVPGFNIWKVGEWSRRKRSERNVRERNGFMLHNQTWYLCSFNLYIPRTLGGRHIKCSYHVALAQHFARECRHWTEWLLPQRQALCTCCRACFQRHLSPGSNQWTLSGGSSRRRSKKIANNWVDRKNKKDIGLNPRMSVMRTFDVDDVDGFSHDRATLHNVVSEWSWCNGRVPAVNRR